LLRKARRARSWGRASCLCWGLGGLCAVTILLVTGCEKAYFGPPPETPQTQLEYARRLLEKGRYYDAIAELTSFVSQNPGSGMMDTALFYLAEAYMGRKDYAMAATEYERLLREFPGSGHAEAARYSLGVAYFEQSLPAELDPTMTDRALEQFSLFLKLHPDSPKAEDARKRIALLREKKAKKRYLNGRLYLKLRQPDAARFYFEHILAEYAETEWAPKALLGIAKSYEMQRNVAAAIGRYKELLKTYPNSDEAGEAKKKLRELGVEFEEAPRSAAREDSNAAAGHGSR